MTAEEWRLHFRKTQTEQPLLYNQTIDLLWHLLSEEGVKEKYLKLCGSYGYDEFCAKDMFDDTNEALKFYYNESFKKLPDQKPLIVEP